MRIAILTLPLHTNYGGILQAYALQTVLERMGNKVDVLTCSQMKKIPVLWPYSYLKRFVKKFILRKKVIIRSEQYHNKYYPLLSKNTQPFIDSYINQRNLKSFEEIQPSDYDAFVVGSDQVWRPCCFKPMWDCSMENAFLKFTEGWNLNRIVYAASFGSDSWEYDENETLTCKKLVKQFSVVTVREKTGVDLCKTYLGVDAQVVPDPTMLLNQEDYVALIEKSNVPKSNGNLLCYILDETAEKSKLIDIVAAERKLTPFRVNSKIENPFAPIEDRIQPSVEQWLRGFFDAEFIVTDSFHACVFSIIFGKPFIVYGNAARGLTRFKSLLSQFGLEKNLITSISDYSLLCGKNVTSLRMLSEFRNDGIGVLKGAFIDFLTKN